MAERKKIYINISFDDLHPEKGRWAMDDKEIQMLLQLKNIYPDIIYTFFTVPHFLWTMESSKINLLKRRLHLLWLKFPLLSFAQTKQDYLISHHPQWIKFIQEQIKSWTFEIGIHWYSHYAPYVVPMAEFRDLSRTENENKIQDSLALFKTSNIPITMMFRPPARWTNPTLRETVIKFWFKYLSLNPTQTLLEYDETTQTFNLPQNYSIESPDYEPIQKHLEKYNYLFIKGHIYKGLKNGIRDDTINNLTNLLWLLSTYYDIQFIAINDLNHLYLTHQLHHVHKV